MSCLCAFLSKDGIHPTREAQLTDEDASCWVFTYTCPHVSWMFKITRQTVRGLRAIQRALSTSMTRVSVQLTPSAT